MLCSKRSVVAILVIASLFTFCNVNAQQGWVPLESKVITPYSSSPINAIATTRDGSKVFAGIDDGVYQWNGNGWIRLGTGSLIEGGGAGPILCLATDVAGNIYAGGWFTNATGRYCVAKWNGTKWVEVGSLDGSGTVEQLIIDDNNNIYARGSFRNNVAEQYIAKWNGTTWAELGSGANRLAPNEDLRAMAIDKAGNVYTTGRFTNAGGQYYVAKWNGAKWAELGGLNANNFLNSLVTTPNGDVYAAGFNTGEAGLSVVSKWHAGSWVNLPGTPAAPNPGDYLWQLGADSTGNVYAVGSGDFALTQWDGTFWRTVDGLNANQGNYNIAFDKTGNIYAARFFTDVNNHCYVAQYTKATAKWSRLGVTGAGYLLTQRQLTGAVVSPKSIFALSDPDVYEWNGNYWATLPPLPYTTAFSFHATSIVADKKGNIYAGGQQDSKILMARWDGKKWTALDSIGGYLETIPATGGILKMVADTLGNVYALVRQNGNMGIIIQWDGNKWGNIIYYNNNGAKQVISTIAVDDAGKLYAGLYSYFDNRGYFVARYDSAAWVEVGTPGAQPFSQDEISQLAIGHNGNIYASVGGVSGGFVTGIKKWDGTKWSLVGDYNTFREVNSLATDAAGGVYAGAYAMEGGFKVLHYTDSGWVETGAKNKALKANARIEWLGTDNKNNLYAAGDFTNIDGYTYMARYALGDVLPAQLKDFGGTIAKRTALLHWQTAQEVNTRYFTVERSIDGSRFSGVGTVAAAGNSAAMKNYSFNDGLAGVPGSITTLYYRLAVVDKDGAATRSNIITLGLTGANQQWGAAIYPVPAKSLLHIQLSNITGSAVLSIADAQGKQLLAGKTVAGDGITHVNVSLLKAGVYFVRVLVNGESKTLRFVKQ